MPDHSWYGFGVLYLDIMQHANMWPQYSRSPLLRRSLSQPDAASKFAQAWSPEST